MSPRAALLALLLGASLPGGALLAQQPRQRELIDRVAAVVGDRVVLLSEIDEAIQQQRAGGMTIPEDSAGYARLRREALDALIDEEVVYQTARRDTTIQVADQEVQARVDEEYRTRRQQFRTELEWGAQLRTAGFGSPEEYRRYLGDQLRRMLYFQRYFQKMQQEGRLHASAPSERELRDAYAQVMRDTSQQRRPATVTWRQIVITPRPSAAARLAAQAEAESALAQIRAGADFTALARRLSDDTESRDQGGDLGWFRRGVMVKEFEDVAFRLRPGNASPLVQTPFGYHIIMVDRVQPAEIKARHILFAPEVSDTGRVAARALADSIARMLRAGLAFDSLHRLYADTSEPRQQGPVARERLTPDLQQAFAAAQPGQVLDPLVLDAERPNRARYMIAVVTDVQPERQFTFDEMRDFIRQRIQDDRARKQAIEQLRRATYIDIRLL